MKKSVGIRFVLAAAIALAVGVTGCGDDGGSGGSAGTGGEAGTGGAGGEAGTGGAGGEAGAGGAGGEAGTGGAGGEAGTGGAGVSFATDIQPYFAANCGGCHIDGSNVGGVNLDTRDNIVNNGAPLVVPFDSADPTATLIPKLNDDHNNGPEDPPNGTAFVETLSQWIDEGALDN